MNICIHTGRITKDPTIKDVNGKPKVTFTIAVKRDFKNKEGKYESDFLLATAWNAKAEFVEKYIKKGYLLEISSRLKSYQYESEGKKQHFTYLEVQNISILSSPKSDIINYDDFYEIDNTDIVFPVDEVEEG